MNELIVIGAGGHGRVVVDIAQKLNKYKKISFLDDNNFESCIGVQVIGTLADIDKYLKNSEIFVAIGNNEMRKDLLRRLVEKGAIIPTLIHPNSVIGACVDIGYGTVIMPGAIVNACAKIGNGVILNTSCSVDHDSVVGDFSHVAVGANVAGTVCIGEEVFVGAGSVIKNNLTICSNCIVGAGAVVVKNIEKQGIYVGVPAKRK